ncbi:hypothetical protein QBC39DRAFT_421551 [Podospora conica]|nr:hypothetical protein QBC39DRAFT_421551 [Schizothecium conicum]
MNIVFLLAMACGLGPAVASPALAALTGPSPKTVPVQVVLLQEKSTSKVSLTALTADSSGILARSCSNSLSTGPFRNMGIRFDVDENGAGNITIGADSFPIHAGVDASNTIICNRIDSKVDSLVSCTFAIPSSSMLAATPAYHEDLAECFSSRRLGVAGFLQLPSKVAELSRRGTWARDQHQNFSPAPRIMARQDECTLWNYYTVKVGDGDPHQAPLHIQLSTNIRCGDGVCGVSHAQSTSYTIGFSFSGGGGGPFAWIDAGFSVQTTVETGTAFMCEAGHGETVCIWKEMGRTAYRVRNRGNNWCFGERDYEELEIVSPNSHDLGTEFYCVRGQQYCRSTGQRYESDRFRGGPGQKCC